VIGEIRAALGAGFLGTEILRIQVGGTCDTSARRGSPFVAAETAADAALEVLVKVVVSRAVIIRRSEYNKKTIKMR